jgi:aminopeptidase N
LYSFLLALAVAALLFGPPAAAQPVVHHELRVVLQPEQGRLEVRDVLHLPDDWSGALDFVLHAGLDPQVEGTEARLDARGPLRRAPHLEAFRLHPTGERSIALRYAGVIEHPVFPGGIPPISSAGVHLDGASYWYPTFGPELVSLEVEVTLPPGWRSVSQGARTDQREDAEGVTERWEEGQPQQDVQLVAGPFHEYLDESGPVTAMAFLRSHDPALAKRYLDATHEYIALYEELIGSYPYAKFALVEHFWESGLGFPSFTLLGSRVIRLPFILYTSYPHEILHNWWGNGVYIDYASGNWGEGLTTYLSDHLMRERRGEGAEHRRAALLRYTNFVTEQRDFPLTEFRARHTEVAQAVGYDKTLMFFHMLRLRLGDERFLAGLQELYRTHRFAHATFTDVRRALETAGGEDLRLEFEQWVERAGAPFLSAGHAEALADGDGYRLRLQLEQTQRGRAYALRVPLAVQLEGEDAPWEAVLSMDAKRKTAELELPARPWRVYVDPRFDIMRRLDRREIPPALSQLFGAERALVVLPAEAPQERRAAYRAVADGLGVTGSVELRWDSELEHLPEDRTVWLLGWENRFRPVLEEQLAGQDVSLEESGARIDGQELRRDEHGVVVVARHPQDLDLAVGWLAFDRLEGLPDLVRKVRRYGGLSYLGFVGDEADNVLQGRWPVIDSPLWLEVKQPDGARPPPRHATIPPRQPLAQ